MISQAESGLSAADYAAIQTATRDLSVSVTIRRYGPVMAAHEDAGTYYQRVLNLNPLAYWPLWESAGLTAEDISGNGYDATYKNTGITYGEDGIGDGYTSVCLNGAGVISCNAAGLMAAWPGAEGSLTIWHYDAAAIFNDGIIRRYFFGFVDWDNFLIIAHTGTNATLQTDYEAGNVREIGAHAIGTAPSSFHSVGVTWSKANDQVKYFYDGVRHETDTGIGVWAGNPTTIYIGATSAVPANPYIGWMAHVSLFGIALTEPQMLTVGAL
jgi:hypothetical protein